MSAFAVKKLRPKTAGPDGRRRWKRRRCQFSRSMKGLNTLTDFRHRRKYAAENGGRGQKA